MIRWNQYHIIHKETGLYWSGHGAGISKIIDYNAVFWPGKTIYSSLDFYPVDMVFSYNSGKFFNNRAAMMFNILQSFINPIHYKHKSLKFNAIKYFLDNFDVVHHKTKKSIIDKKFLQALIKTYLKDKVNGYAQALGYSHSSHSANKILYDNLLKIRFGIIFKDKKQAKEYNKRFLEGDIVEKYELHLSGMFFQDEAAFTLCKLASPNNVITIDFAPLMEILQETNKAFEEQFLNKLE